MRSLPLSLCAVAFAVVATSAQVSWADVDMKRDLNAFPKPHGDMEALRIWKPRSALLQQQGHRGMEEAVMGMGIARRAEEFRTTPPPRNFRPTPQPRPQPGYSQPGSTRPAPNQNPGNGQGTFASGQDGGTSASGTARGGDANQGGANSSTGPGAPADGRLEQADMFPNATEAINSASFAADHAFAEEQPQYRNSMERTHMKRIFRNHARWALKRRQASAPDVADSISNSPLDFAPQPSSSNSGQDGKDGQSIRGKEANGGHSGMPGSSEGGHVYHD